MEEAAVYVVARLDRVLNEKISEFFAGVVGGARPPRALQTVSLPDQVGHVYVVGCR